MLSMKKTLYSVAVFIVLLILIRVFVDAMLSSIISDVYLENLLTLLISVGLSFYVTKRIVYGKTKKKLY